MPGRVRIHSFYIVLPLITFGASAKINVPVSASNISVVNSTAETFVVADFWAEFNEDYTTSPSTQTQDNFRSTNGTEKPCVSHQLKRARINN